MRLPRDKRFKAFDWREKFVFRFSFFFYFMAIARFFGKSHQQNRSTCCCFGNWISLFLSFSFCRIGSFAINRSRQNWPLSLSIWCSLILFLFSLSPKEAKRRAGHSIARSLHFVPKTEIDSRKLFNAVKSVWACACVCHQRRTLLIDQKATEATVVGRIRWTMAGTHDFDWI